MIERINILLINWARWRLGGRVELMARPAIYDMGQRVIDADVPRDHYIPLDALQCSRTDIAVSCLDEVLRRTIHETYCRMTTMALAARALRISERALYLRIDRAHILIRETLDHGHSGIRMIDPCGT